MYQQNEAAGLICSGLFDYFDNASLSFSCVDTNAEHVKWLPSIPVVKKAEHWQTYVRRDGAWFAYSTKSESHVLDYDLAKNRLIDTRYPGLGGYLFIHGVDSNQVLACGLNGEGRQLYLYNHLFPKKGWQIIGKSNTKTYS